MIGYVNETKDPAGGRPAVVAALILAALLTICFFPFVAGNKTFLESSLLASIIPEGSWAGSKSVSRTYLHTHDAAAPAYCGEPWLALLKDEYLNHKTLPVWNPYQAFGTPLAANMQSQAYSPVTVAFALIHSPRTYNWYILLRLWVAGFFAYLLMRNFVSFVPALASGVSAMFAGYYVLFITMPHLSVEVMTPAALWAAERILRRPGYRSALYFAIVVFFVLIGGMPESSLLALTLTYAYLIFRVATEHGLRERVVAVAKSLLGATIGGIGFSAVLLVPFRQFLRYSFNTHQFVHRGTVVGLMHDPFDHSIFTYLLPFLYGTGSGSPCYNYAGPVAFFLILVGLLGLKWKGSEKNRTLSLLTCFFVGVIVCVIGKRYGAPYIQWIGSLPLFNLVIYAKYEEAVLSVAVAILCGIGLERLVMRQLSTAKQMAALAISLLTIPLALVTSWNAIVKEVTANDQFSGLIIWSLAVAISSGVVLALVLAVLNGKEAFQGVRERKAAFAIGSGVIAVLLCESIFSYIVPTYYVWNGLPTVANNPYVGAPFIDKLKQTAGRNRVFAKNAILYPNWASAFELFDIRDLDAMYYWRYISFVKNFFRLEPRQMPDGWGELQDRFTGQGIYSLNDYLQRRLLQLSSVKYVVAAADSELPVKGLVQEIGGDKLMSIPLKIGDSTRPAMGGQAPYTVSYRFHVDDAKRTLHFSYGINPGAFGGACGDGAEFVVEAKGNSGAARTLFSSFIDPKHVMALRRWIDGSVDLTSYLGKDVELLIEANGGPKGDVCGDWAYWSDFEFGDQQGEAKYKRIYNNEVSIFEVKDVLPRAAVYFQAETAGSDKDVLDRLVDPNLDVFKTVMMNRTGLSGDDAKWIEGLKNSSDQAVEEAEIVSYSPREVVIRASLKKRGILVLNDSNFPGWKVTVDGAPRKVLDANFLFRGVLLEPGEHVVKFRYQPWSVTLGASISGASFACFAGVGIWRRRRKL